MLSLGNCITPETLCSNYLPGASLMSLLINAESTFKRLSVSLSNDELNQDNINNGVNFLKYFLIAQVDFNGDGIITTNEVMDALTYRSVNATGLSSNLNVWSCSNHVSSDCNSTEVRASIIFEDALNCFLTSSKNLFDCSGVSILTSLKTEIPISDDNTVCSKSDQTWYPKSYSRPYTNW